MNSKVAASLSLPLRKPNLKAWLEGKTLPPQSQAALQRELPAFNPEHLHLPADYPQHPLLTPLLQQWVRTLYPLPVRTRGFLQRCRAGQGKPVASQVNELSQQLAHVLDIQPWEIACGGNEHQLYAEAGLLNERQVIVAHPELAQLPRTQQRFLLVRALYSHFQRHNALQCLVQSWTPELRAHLLSVFFTWNQRHSKPILNEDWGRRDHLPTSLTRMSAWLNQLYLKYRSPALADLREVLLRSQPFRSPLESEANLFATLACGIETARITLPQLYTREAAQTHLERLFYRLDAMEGSAH